MASVELEAVVGLAGVPEFKLTTGVTAESVVAVVVVCVEGVAGAGAAGAGADCVTVVRVVTVRAGAGAGAGRAVAVWVVRATVRVFTDLVLATGADVPLSLATEALLSVTGGGSTLTGGAVVVDTGAGSVGCTACASNGVEESAKAAAIAGSALVRA